MSNFAIACLSIMYMISQIIYIVSEIIYMVSWIIYMVSQLIYMDTDILCLAVFDLQTLISLPLHLPSHIISIFFQQTIVDEQLLLKRMSNVAIDMFGMTAVLSRATRTITKGDANADYEVSKYLTFITTCNTFIYIYIY